jgi:hypothetical protein
MQYLIQAQIYKKFKYIVITAIYTHHISIVCNTEQYSYTKNIFPS